MENNEKRSPLTWAELKEFINNLPPEMLEKTVSWWGEERGGTVKHIMVLEEDYGENGGDYQEPRSVYEENAEDLEENPFETDFEKGTPILFVD